MAMDAAYRIRIADIPFEQLMHHVIVALDAIMLKNPLVLPLDHDGLVEVLQCKALGMVVAVLGFRHVLGKKRVRKMAVDAGGNAVVAGFLPRVVLRIHDMAIGAGFGISAEVGKPLGIPEGERSGSH
jgi:hypothetical protein